MLVSKNSDWILKMHLKSCKHNSTILLDQIRYCRFSEVVRIFNDDCYQPILTEVSSRPLTFQHLVQMLKITQKASEFKSTMLLIQNWWFKPNETDKIFTQLFGLWISIKVDHLTLKRSKTSQNSTNHLENHVIRSVDHKHQNATTKKIK